MSGLRVAIKILAFAAQVRNPPLLLIDENGPLPPLRNQGFATAQLHQTGRLCPRAACHGKRRSKGRTNLPSPPVGQE